MNTFFWLIPSIPPVCRVGVAIPIVGLNSSMACRVYRELKLELVDREEQQSDQNVAADAVFTTRVQVIPLTEVLSAKDVETSTSGFPEPSGR